MKMDASMVVIGRGMWPEVVAGGDRNWIGDGEGAIMKRGWVGSALSLSVCVPEPLCWRFLSLEMG